VAGKTLRAGDSVRPSGAVGWSSRSRWLLEVGIPRGPDDQQHSSQWHRQSRSCNLNNRTPPNSTRQIVVIGSVSAVGAHSVVGRPLRKMSPASSLDWHACRASGAARPRLGAVGYRNPSDAIWLSREAIVSPEWREGAQRAFLPVLMRDRDTYQISFITGI